MNKAAASVIFLAVVNSKQEERQARLLIESLRAFGGELRDCPVWIFQPGTERLDGFGRLGDVSLLPLEIEAPYRRYELADKVFACARAEELAGPEVSSLVWTNLDCLIVNPPVLFALDSTCDAALRPVHIRNVGSPANEPLDDYWQAVYQETGVERIPYTVESFVDAQTIRPYYNTHCFSINPAKGILQAWREHFKSLVIDEAFQAGPCRDERHQVFLHQVVLSALIMKTLDQERLRWLPAAYSYPLHLQPDLPASRRIHSLNRMVCVVFEEADKLDQVEAEEPLKKWLAAHK